MIKNLFLTSLLLLPMALTSCDKLGGSKYVDDYLSVQVEDSKMWSLMDVDNGELVMTDEFFSPATIVVNGSFFVENDNQSFDLYNLKDTKNKLNRNSFTTVSNFNKEGFAITRIKEEPWQIIDTEGKIIATIDKKINVLSGFSEEGMALIQNSDELCGFINTKGEIVIKPRYKFASIFSDGVAFVLTKEENNHNYISAIDPQGNTIFSFSDAKYSDVSLFNNGYMFAVEGDHCVLLNKEGNKIMKVCQGDDLSNLSVEDGNIIYFDGEYYGVKNTEDKILIRAKYKKLSFIGNKRLLATNNNDKTGVIDINDDIVLPFDYENLYFVSPDRYITSAGNVFILINDKGKEISKKALNKFSNRTDFTSPWMRTALISSQNNNAEEDNSENMLLNLENLEDSYYEQAPSYDYNDSYIPEGYNMFTGEFLFKGAKYGFMITFNYRSDISEGVDALYEATGTGQTNKINLMHFGENDKYLRIEGPNLIITATRGADGVYRGEMTRGTHSGTIEMELVIGD